MTRSLGCLFALLPVFASACIDLPKGIDFSSNAESTRLEVRKDGAHTVVQGCPSGGLGLNLWGCPQSGSVGSLVVCADDRCAPFAFHETSELSDGSVVGLYQVRFDEAHGGSRISFSHGPGSPAAVVAVPPDFAISAPAQDSTFSASHDQIHVTWDPPPPPGAHLSWATSGDCTASGWATIGVEEGIDAAGLTIPAGRLTQLERGQSCAATIEIHIAVPGAVDAGFQPAETTLEAEQVRTLSLTLVP